nr:MAG TPA: hypothetical protein [Caudoviricetes sp.]
MPVFRGKIGIVENEHNDSGGVRRQTARTKENGPCFEHGPFFTRFRGEPGSEK